MYADDTSLTFASTGIEHINDCLNHDLSNVYECLSANKLTLNMTKTEFMLIAQGRSYLTTYGKSLSYYKRKRNWTSNLRYMTVLAENSRALVRIALAPLIRLFRRLRIGRFLSQIFKQTYDANSDSHDQVIVTNENFMVFCWNSRTKRNAWRQVTRNKYFNH